MGVTTNYSLPYPASTDAPNGASQIQALAVAVDSAIAAATATQFVVPLFARKATDEGRASTTTLANDTSLAVAGLISGAIYEVQALIAYDGGAGGSEGDLKWKFTVPTSSSGTYGYTRARQTDGLFTGAFNSLWTDTNTAQTTGVGASMCLQIKGLLVAGANGTLTFQWAQNSSNVTNTHILTNSYLLVRRAA